MASLAKPMPPAMSQPSYGNKLQDIAQDSKFGFSPTSEDMRNAKMNSSQGFIPQPVGGLIDMPTDEPEQPATTAPSFMDRLTSANGLGSIGAMMLSMSNDPNLQKLGMAGMEQSRNRMQSNRTLEFLKAKGVDDDTIAALRDNPQMISAYAASMLKQPKNAQSTIGKIQADYEGGAYGKVGSKEALALRDRAMAIAEKSGSTDISLKMGDEYGTTLAKGFADSDIQAKQNAIKASRVIPKLQETIALIEDPDTNVGLFSDIQTGIDKLIAAFGGADALKSLSQTEKLNAYLGSDVFAALGALGLGSKNMDTPAEREFLREVMTGKVTNSRPALIAMAKERLNAQMDALDSYNTMVESGEFGYTKGTPLEGRFGKVEFEPYQKKGIQAGAVRYFNGEPYVLTSEGDPNLTPDNPNSAWKRKQ
jgi:hypothetical protein